MITVQTLAAAHGHHLHISGDQMTAILIIAPILIIAGLIALRKRGGRSRSQRRRTYSF